MPKCAEGHETQIALKCPKCGASVRFKESLSELLSLPPLDLRFEEAAVLFVGVSRTSDRGVFAAEMVLGTEERTAKKFVAEKLEGGTWLDYNAKYAEAFKSWLRLVEFGGSKYRVVVLDSTNPLAVLAVNSIPLPESTVLLASYPRKSGTPTTQNTSYATLQLARRRGMHLVLAVDSFAEHLAIFVEGKGLFTGEKAYCQVVSHFLSFLPDVVDLVQKDSRLGIGIHFFSVLLSGSNKVFRSMDEALGIQVSQNSLEGSYEGVMSTHLLASALPEAEKDIKLSFGRLCSAPGQSLLNAEFKFRNKPTSHGLYDIFLLFGAKEPTLFEDLRKGYQTIASSAPDLSLEGRLSSASLPLAPEVEGDEDQPDLPEKAEQGQVSLMRDFVQTRAQVFDLLLRLRADPRQALLDFSAEVPPEKQPLEGLFRKYTDWLDGVFDEFSSSLAEADGLPPEVAERICAVAYCIGSVQNSIFSGSEEERKKSLDVLAELGAERAKIDGLGVLAATEALLRGSDAAIHKAS